jgi:cob(I)alamin adenosyltransferase
MVNLTRIYTKTGDGGQTTLGDMSRTAKTDPRLAAYADVDEANSAIGVVLACTPAEDGGDGEGGLDAGVVRLLQRVQNDLFDVGADLSTPLADAGSGHQPLRIREEYVAELEAACDHYNADLAPLRSFILPGGTPAAAYLHVARTVTRRAERSNRRPRHRPGRRGQPRRCALPEPAVRPAVHPLPPGQRRTRRRPLAARWRPARRRGRAARLSGGPRSAEQRPRTRRG